MIIALAALACQWQPLDAAARSGAVVLLTVETFYDGRRERHAIPAHYQDGQWWNANESPKYGYADPLTEDGTKPLYWMPMPAPKKDVAHAH